MAMRLSALASPVGMACHPLQVPAARCIATARLSLLAAYAGFRRASDPQPQSTIPHMWTNPNAMFD